MDMFIKTDDSNIEYCVGAEIRKMRKRLDEVEKRLEITETRLSEIQPVPKEDKPKPVLWVLERFTGCCVERDRVIDYLAKRVKLKFYTHDTEGFIPANELKVGFNSNACLSLSLFRGGRLMYGTSYNPALAFDFDAVERLYNEVLNLK